VTEQVVLFAVFGATALVVLVVSLVRS